MKILMSNLINTTLLTCVLLLSQVFSQNIVLAADKSTLSFSTTEVAPGLYMLIGVGGFTGGNIALSIGDDGVVMIDDSMPPMLDIMQTAIRSVTDQPVDFLINTHVHGDHTGNNETMGKNGTWIVAHKNLRQHMLDKGIRGKDGMIPAPKAALPVITFAHSMDFHLNGYDAHIFHVKNAHTDGDLVIYYKAANVIHTGDAMFNEIFPFIDLDNGGSIDGYIAAQKKIFALSDAQTKIIPGHGPLANKDDLESSIAMLEGSKSIISALIAEGKTEEQIVTLNPLAKQYQQWHWQFITTERMTRTLYKGLTGSQQQLHDAEHHQHSKTKDGAAREIQ